ncbi:MAG: SIS domain-containing protein [Anaerolineae bacterium]|jgi:fructoselysine 6-phosphate deglycase|nr:SIS domain-containing protein [Anaerolineae bacterium]
MKESATILEFDQSHFLNQFSGSLALLDAAVQSAQQLGSDPINKIFFVACGAPHQLFLSLEYWATKYAANLTFHRYFPAELIQHNPVSLDADSLVIFGSHSGTTQETVAAAKFIQQTPAKSLAITQSTTSPLGAAVDHTIAYGNTEQGYFSAFMLGFAFLSALLTSREPAWKFHTSVMESLHSLPHALAEAKAMKQYDAVIQAQQLSKSPQLYVLGSGPMFATAYVFANCFLMEMQWMHAHALQGAEFFHGPFEVVDPSTPLLLLIGEDPSRVIAERVHQFTRQYSQNTIVYDAQEFPMTGIAPEIRPMVAPMIVDAAMTNLVEALAILRGHPMTKRRYMGKVNY